MPNQTEIIDPDPIEYSFPCIRASQPIGDIFIAAIPFKVLIRISHFDVRRVMQEDRDLLITEIVANYFNAVRKKWPEAWDETGRGRMLNRTNGFRALMRFLRHAYLDVAAPGDVPSVQKFFDRVFHKIDLNDDDFTINNFPPGTSGEALLFRVLRGQDSIVRR